VGVASEAGKRTHEDRIPVKKTIAAPLTQASPRVVVLVTPIEERCPRTQQGQEFSKLMRVGSYRDLFVCCGTITETRRCVGLLQVQTQCCQQFLCAHANGTNTIPVEVKKGCLSNKSCRETDMVQQANCTNLCWCIVQEFYLLILGCGDPKRFLTEERILCNPISTSRVLVLEHTIYKAITTLHIPFLMR